MSTCIEANDLTKSFHGRTVVDGVSFHVKTGEVFGLLGHNGAGKSTTIDLLLGLKKPEKGSGTIFGMQPREHRKEVFERFRNNLYAWFSNSEDITSKQAEMYNMPAGVYITEVAKKGAADKAGIVRGDIITAVNGTKVETRSALQNRITSKRIGTTVTITYMRSEGGKYVEHEAEAVLQGYDSLGDLGENEDAKENQQDNQGKSDDGVDYGDYYDEYNDFYNDFFKDFFYY